jgi:hypothetical protein
MRVACQTYGGPEGSSPPIWESPEELARAVYNRQLAVLCLQATLSPEGDDAMRALVKRRAADLVLAGYGFRP